MYNLLLLSSLISVAFSQNNPLQDLNKATAGNSANGIAALTNLFGALNQLSVATRPEPPAAPKEAPKPPALTPAAPKVAPNPPAPPPAAPKLAPPPVAPQPAPPKPAPSQPASPQPAPSPPAPSPPYVKPAPTITTEITESTATPVKSGKKSSSISKTISKKGGKKRGKKIKVKKGAIWVWEWQYVDIEEPVVAPTIV